MTISQTIYTSRSVEWPTPQQFYNELNREFSFTLDLCANDDNHKCTKYYTSEHDGLIQDWKNHRVFCNPPYGRTISDWVHKCYQVSLNGALVVLLIPARTDTKWFHNWVYGKAEMRFVKGRLKFGDGKNSAPFPSLVAIFKPSDDV